MEQQGQLSQKTHKRMPFSGDLEMIKNQNPTTNAPEFKNNDDETFDKALGFEDGEKEVFEPNLCEKTVLFEVSVQKDGEKDIFEPNLCEKSNIFEDGVQRDGEKSDFEPNLCEKSNLLEDGVQINGDEFDGYDDEEVERMINEELKEFVLNLAIGEQKGSFNGEGVLNEVGNNEWGEYEDEEFGEVGNLENGNWGREEEGLYNAKKMVYPLRPDAEDCAFYMKTGSCKYGFHCKFNHPPVPRRKYQPPKDKIKPREEHLERSGQTECKADELLSAFRKSFRCSTRKVMIISEQLDTTYFCSMSQDTFFRLILEYYLSTGGCKFGKACKFIHSRERSTVSPAPEFNFLGLPIRPGENECPYYMRNGSCKYGSTCRFHHPDPSAGSRAYGNGAPLPGTSQSAPWSSPRALSNAASFMPIMYPPAQGMHSSTTDWNGYQASVYPKIERSLPTPPAFTMNSLPTLPAFTMNNLGTEASFPSRHHQPLFMDEFPERPGQPECSYFLKTGDCKYKSNCRFHHPKNRDMKSSSWAISDKGLPLRPDHPVCSFYQRYGICKFGPACKFDHPENMGNSVHSSLSDFERSSFGNAVA